MCAAALADAKSVKTLDSGKAPTSAWPPRCLDLNESLLGNKRLPRLHGKANLLKKTWEHEHTSVEQTSLAWARTRLEDPDDYPSSIKTTKTAGCQSGNFKLTECKKQSNVAGSINSADMTMFVAASTSKAAAAHDVKSVKPLDSSKHRSHGRLLLIQCYSA